MKKIVLALIILVVGCLGLVMTYPVAAAPPDSGSNNSGSNNSGSNSSTTVPNAGSAKIDRPAGVLDMNDKSLKNAFNRVYVIVGMLAVGAIVYGGFLYASSNGEPAKIATAKNTIVGSIVGLIVVILAFSITNLVLSLVG